MSCVSDSQVEDGLRPLVMKTLGVPVACRACGAELSAKSRTSMLAGKRVKCPSCEWYGNWRDNTVLERSTISNLQFITLWNWSTLPTEAYKLSCQINLSPTTVAAWRKRIKEMLTT